MNITSVMLFIGKTVFVLLIMFNIYYFGHKIQNKIHKIMQKKQQGETGGWYDAEHWISYYNKIKDITVEELNNQFILYKGKKYLNCNYFNWPSAILAEAIEVSSSNTEKETDLKVLIKYYDKYIDAEGNFIGPVTINYLDQVMHGYTLIYLEQVTGNKKYSRTIRMMYNYLRECVRSKNWIIPYRANSKELILVDSLGMICPFLTRYGKVYNNLEATRIAERQLIDFIDNGVDTITGLPYHGYISDRKGYVGILGWGRGTGWYLMGLVGTLENLSIESNSREKMLVALNKVAESLEYYQRDDGAWNWAITNPYDNKDMSATAISAYTLEKAIELNCLTKNYYKMLDRVFGAIVFETTDKGYILNASGDCNGVGKYSTDYGNYPWVQGPATAFTALILKRKNYSR